MGDEAPCPCRLECDDRITAADFASEDKFLGRGHVGLLRNTQDQLKSSQTDSIDWHTPLPVLRAVPLCMSFRGSWPVIVQGRATTS